MPKNRNTKTNADRLKEEFYKGMAELRESQKRAEEELREGRRRAEEELRESQKEEEKRGEKWNKEMAELRETVKELSKNIGGVNRSLGKISEDMSIPKIERLFYKFKIDISGYHPDVRVRYDGKRKEKEVDLILVGTFNRRNTAVVVETKTRYRKTKEIDKFDTFLKQEFKQIFNEYKNYKVIGCVCALGYGTGLEKYAERKGLFVMKPTKGIVGIVNKPDFKFKTV